VDDRDNTVPGGAKESAGKVTGDSRLESETETRPSQSKIEEKLREVTDMIRGTARRAGRRRP
jgi:uncharacterized protein YjbJ (UPF0337 family)